jgi:hypothetical protein
MTCIVYFIQMCQNQNCQIMHQNKRMQTDGRFMPVQGMFQRSLRRLCMSRMRHLRHIWHRGRRCGRRSMIHLLGRRFQIWSRVCIKGVQSVLNNTSSELQRAISFLVKKIAMQ